VVVFDKIIRLFSRLCGFDSGNADILNTQKADKPNLAYAIQGLRNSTLTKIEVAEELNMQL
jgi:hypothetical protein